MLATILQGTVTRQQYIFINEEEKIKLKKIDFLKHQGTFPLFWKDKHLTSANFLLQNLMNISGH
jgi:hypothetical protein